MKQPQQDVQVTISNQTILRIIAFGIATYAGFRFFDNIRHALTLIFFSFFLAMALNPAVSAIANRLRSKSRVGATAVAYLAVLSVLILFVATVVPPLIRQSTDFIRDIPSTINNLENQNSAIGDFARRYNLSDQASKYVNEWTDDLGNATGPLLTTANRILSGLVSLFTVLVLTFMMLIEGPTWINRLVRNLPKHRREHTKKLLHRMYILVTKFVNAQVFVALIGGVFALIALTIASNVYNASINPVALAGIVFLFAIIPTIGSILAAVIVSLVCLFASVPLAITMLIYFVIYQQIENVTIQPYVQSRSNDLSPLLVFIAALLGIGFGGLLGGFVAIPAAGCVRILIEDYLDSRSEARKASE